MRWRLLAVLPCRPTSRAAEPSRVGWAKAAEAPALLHRVGPAVPTWVRFIAWARRVGQCAVAELSRPPLPTLRFQRLELRGCAGAQKRKVAADREEAEAALGGEQRALSVGAV